MSNSDLIASLQALDELIYRRARTDYRTFVLATKADYDMQWFHAVICSKLQSFAEGRIKNLMILMPPQHGKSQLATRQFPPFLLGRDPDVKIAVASYSQTVASGFNRAIQLNIDNEIYGEIFPETKLNYSQIFGTNADNVSRNDKLMEIVGHAGNVRTVGRGGSLTSHTVDIGIIDDLYKDRAEAISPTISESAYQWYLDVFKTRLHNDSQQLMMNTRWDNLDLAGRLLMTEPDEWEIVKFKGIKTADIVEYDPREIGQALYPSKHSLERLLQIEKNSEVTFNSLYQQEPGGAKSLLIYPNVYEIPYLPESDHYFWGLDLGKTVSKTVLTKGCRDHVGHYLDELCYKPDISAAEIKILLIGNGYKEGQVVWTDHKPSFINELRLIGINAANAIKGEGSVVAGINKMKEKKIYITKRSVNARREANNYRFIAFMNIITNEPEKKGFEHFWDSARYGLYGDYFQRPHN